MKAALQNPLARLLLGGATPGARDGTPDPRRILVLRPDNRLGNLILLTPLLAGARQIFPEAAIGLWIGRRYAPLLGRHPCVDALFASGGRLRDLAAARRIPWDAAISTHFPGATSTSATLLLAWSRAPIRIGYDDPRHRAALTHARPVPVTPRHAVEELQDLLQPIANGPLPGLREPAIAVPRAPAAHPGWPAGTSRRPILVHTGGRGAKGWSLEGFRRLALGLCDHGYEVWVVPGPGAPAWRPDPGERNLRILRPMGITDLARVLKSAGRFVGCDTGVMHLAAATGTAVTALFRSSDPRRYAPMGARHRVLIAAEGSLRCIEAGGWPSLPAGLAPAWDALPPHRMRASARDQADWVLEAVLEDQADARGAAPPAPGPHAPAPEAQPRLSHPPRPRRRAR